jgi:hypothetical protein
LPLVPDFAFEDPAFEDPRETAGTIDCQFETRPVFFLLSLYRDVSLVVRENNPKIVDCV